MGLCKILSLWGPYIVGPDTRQVASQCRSCGVHHDAIDFIHEKRRVYSCICRPYTVDLLLLSIPIIRVFLNPPGRDSLMVISNKHVRGHPFYTFVDFRKFHNAAWSVDNTTHDVT